MNANKIKTVETANNTMQWFVCLALYLKGPTSVHKGRMYICVLSFHCYSTLIVYVLPVQVPFARVPRFVGTLPVGATSRCLSAPAKQSPTPSTLPAIFHRRPLLLLIYSLLTHCQFTLSFDIEIIVRATSNRKPVYISYHLISILWN